MAKEGEPGKEARACGPSASFPFKKLQVKCHAGGPANQREHVHPAEVRRPNQGGVRGQQQQAEPGHSGAWADAPQDVPTNSQQGGSKSPREQAHDQHLDQGMKNSKEGGQREEITRRKPESVPVHPGDETGKDKRAHPVSAGQRVGRRGEERFVGPYRRGAKEQRQGDESVTSGEPQPAPDGSRSPVKNTSQRPARKRPKNCPKKRRHDFKAPRELHLCGDGPRRAEKARNTCPSRAARSS